MIKFLTVNKLAKTLLTSIIMSPITLSTVVITLSSIDNIVAMEDNKSIKIDVDLNKGIGKIVRETINNNIKAKAELLERQKILNSNDQYWAKQAIESENKYSSSIDNLKKLFVLAKEHNDDEHNKFNKMFAEAIENLINNKNRNEINSSNEASIFALLNGLTIYNSLYTIYNSDEYDKGTSSLDKDKLYLLYTLTIREVYLGFNSSQILKNFIVDKCESKKISFEKFDCFSSKDMNIVAGLLKHDWDCYLTQFGVINDIKDKKGAVLTESVVKTINENVNVSNINKINTNEINNDNKINNYNNKIINSKMAKHVVNSASTRVDGKTQVMQESTINASLLYIIDAMKNRGYNIDYTFVKTKDSERRTTDVRKKAVKFSKKGNHIATFTLDGCVPSCRDLYIWSGCENWESEDEKKLQDKVNFYVALTGLLNDENINADSKLSVNIGRNKHPLMTCARDDRNYFVELFSTMLKYPEGRMLVYSIFLNQAEMYETDNNTISKLWDPINSNKRKDFKYVLNMHKNLKVLYNDDNELTLCVSDITMFDETTTTVKMKRKNTDNKIEETIDFFHELCHYLTMKGKNKTQHDTQYPKYSKLTGSSELNKMHWNSELIVKYWQDLYQIPDSYMYSKNDIKLLINDFFKYVDGDFGSMDEVLAICWNNMGTKYYGNGLCENLLRKRLSYHVRFEHDKHLHFIDSKYLQDNKYPTYSHFLSQYYVKQQSKFNGNSLKEKFTCPYFNKKNNNVLPFETEADTKLVFNTPGCSYFIDLKEFEGNEVGSNEANQNFDLSKADQSALEKHFAQHPTVVFLLYGQFIAYNILDEFFTGNMNTEINKDTLINLLDNITSKIPDLHDKYNEILGVFNSDTDIYGPRLIAKQILKARDNNWQ